MKPVFRLLLLALPALLSACADQDIDRMRTVDPGEIPCASTDPATGIWESAPFDDPACPWLEFSKETALEIPHDLGRTPRIVLPYIAFNPAGTNATLGSGDVARVLGADDVTVSVANATDEQFFLRLVLQ